MNEKKYYVYLMANERKTAIYTGMTNDIIRCVYEHKSKLVKGFTSKYNVSKLVYLEETDSAEAAILREKQIKAGSRRKKIELITRDNVEWADLSKDWFNRDCFGAQSSSQ